MSNWTIARVKNPNLADVDPTNGIWEKYFTYVVKLDGQIVGEIKWKSRPKSSGGPAWEGFIARENFIPEHFRRHLSPGSVGIGYFNRDRKKVMQWFKDGAMEEERIPGFMLRRA